MGAYKNNLRMSLESPREFLNGYEARTWIRSCYWCRNSYSTTHREKVVCNDCSISDWKE